MSLGTPRFDELHVTATFNSGDANAQLNDLDERSDEQGTPCPMPVEGLSDEQQGAVLTEGLELPKYPPEQQKRIFEGDILIEKRRTRPQEDD